MTYQCEQKHEGRFCGLGFDSEQLAQQHADSTRGAVEVYVNDQWTGQALIGRANDLS